MINFIIILIIIIINIAVVDSFGYGNDVVISEDLSFNEINGDPAYLTIKMTNGYFGYLGGTGTLVYNEDLKYYWYVYDNNGHKLINEVELLYGYYPLNLLQVDDKNFVLVFQRIYYDHTDLSTDTRGIYYMKFDINGKTNDKILIDDTYKFSVFEYLDKDTLNNGDTVILYCFDSNGLKTFGLRFNSIGNLEGYEYIENLEQESYRTHFGTESNGWYKKGYVEKLSNGGFVLFLHWRNPQSGKKNINVVYNQNNIQIKSNQRYDNHPNGYTLTYTGSFTGYYFEFRVDTDKEYHDIVIYDNNGDLENTFTLDFKSSNECFGCQGAEYYNIDNYGNNDFIISYDKNEDKEFTFNIDGIDHTIYFKNEEYYKHMDKIVNNIYFDTWYLQSSQKNYICRYDLSDKNLAVKLPTPQTNTQADYSLISTETPTPLPSVSPTPYPTYSPTLNPTYKPTNIPTISPTFEPTYKPTPFPTLYPTIGPTYLPTIFPTKMPSERNLIRPTQSPTNNNGVGESIPNNDDVNEEEPEEDQENDPNDPDETDPVNDNQGKSSDNNLGIIIGFLVMSIIIVGMSIYIYYGNIGCSIQTDSSSVTKISLGKNNMDNRLVANTGFSKI